MPRDVRFFESIGGGRVHYCGLTGAVIDEYFKVPTITGLDVDFDHHDFFALCERAPRPVVLMPTLPFKPGSPVLQRLLRGDWPAKRNIIIFTEAPTVEDAKRQLDQLRKAIPY